MGGVGGGAADVPDEEAADAVGGHDEMLQHVHHLVLQQQPVQHATAEKIQKIQMIPSYFKIKILENVEYALCWEPKGYIKSNYSPLY